MIAPWSSVTNVSYRPCVTVQWNWYWPGLSLSTPRTGPDSPPPIRSLAADGFPELGAA
jgi:hypothetical protein